jgi:Kef-type K+ transport system membrane component KefB
VDYLRIGLKVILNIKEVELKLTNWIKKTPLTLGLLTLLLGVQFWFSSDANASSGHGAAAAQTFLWIAIILLAAKISGFVERFGQPAVLGELVIGVLIGNMVLLGCDFFEPIKHQPIIEFLSELGVVILLFQIGLESTLGDMLKVGKVSLMVAVAGVVVPFVVGTYMVGPLLLPGLDFNAYLFFGATMTATSVGITARVFKDLNALNTPEARIVLGAAVIDDILGLILLAVISVIVTTGTASVGLVAVILAKAIGFLIGSFLLGHFLAPSMNTLFSKIHAGREMKFTLAISTCLVFAYAAQLIGLAPIVGAFAAGLVVTPIHFKDFDEPEVASDLKSLTTNMSVEEKKSVEALIHKYEHHHVDHLIEPLAHFLVPIFFVLTGINVKLDTLFDPKVLTVAIGLSIAAILTKLVTGFFAGKVNRMIVGWGMVPRGEVGLIFAMIGKSLGVVNDEVFSVIVIMVIITTLVTPPMLGMLIKKQKKAASNQA